MYQSITIVGNLGGDPEMRYTPTGKPVANFSVAVNENKDTSPVWFRVTAWERLAEVCNEYLSKGKRVLVVGAVTTSAYTDSEGNPRASLELTARSVKFLSGGPETEGTPALTGEGENIPF